MKVKRLFYNWHPYKDDEHAGEDFKELLVGRNGVVSISEEEFSGRLTYLAKFKDGRFLRIFNPNTVEYQTICHCEEPAWNQYPNGTVFCSNCNLNMGVDD